MYITYGNPKIFFNKETNKNSILEVLIKVKKTKDKLNFFLIENGKNRILEFSNKIFSLNNKKYNIKNEDDNIIMFKHNFYEKELNISSI